MRPQSSSVQPCLTPSEESTARSSSTVMNPSPSRSNTSNASRMDASSASPPPSQSTRMTDAYSSANSPRSTHPSPLASTRAMVAASSSPATGIPSLSSDSVSSSRVIRPSPSRSNSSNTRRSSAWSHAIVSAAAGLWCSRLHVRGHERAGGRSGGGGRRKAWSLWAWKVRGGCRWRHWVVPSNWWWTWPRAFDDCFRKMLRNIFSSDINGSNVTVRKTEEKHNDIYQHYDITNIISNPLK
uniref:Uncharacterized protein n=1 Tax=Oryza brachyantha TaxID=4533 RepID=J3LEK5_ORYBR